MDSSVRYQAIGMLQSGNTLREIAKRFRKGIRTIPEKVYGVLKQSLDELKLVNILIPSNGFVLKFHFFGN